MKIVVTGGAGFIGSHVVDAYVAGGHQVIVVDNLSAGRMENVNPRAKFHQIDIRDSGLRALFEQERPDVINHHAAQIDVRKSVVNPMADAAVNLVGFLNLMECGLASGVKKVVFASTGGAIYGEQDMFPASESHPCRPLSPYGVAKLSTEYYLAYYQAVHGIAYVCLRYANVYGPRQNPHGEAGVVAIFARRLLAGDAATINGDGRQTRDYVYIQDVARANALALDYPHTDIFNIGTGIETDVNTIFNELKTIIGSPHAEIHAPAKVGEQLRSVIDNTKARQLLNWIPQVTLRDGLQETVRFFRA